VGLRTPSYYPDSEPARPDAGSPTVEPTAPCRNAVTDVRGESPAVYGEEDVNDPPSRTNAVYFDSERSKKTGGYAILRAVPSTVSEEIEICSRCEMEIPADSDRCPICGYQPAGRNPIAIRLGEYAFLAACLASVVVFVVGVGGFGPSVLGRMAIVTPYTTGISGFFAYYLHRKRRMSPTDDDVF